MCEDWDVLSSKEQWALENDLKNRWRSARDRFRKDYAAREKSGSSPTGRRKYMHFDALLYLAPTRDLRPTTGNVVEETSQNVEEGAEEADNPAGEGPSTLSGDDLQPDRVETLLGETCSPQDPGGATVETAVANLRQQSRGAGRRALVQRAIESETASLLRRVGNEDLYDGFGHTVAGQCRNLPVGRRASYMAFVLAVSDLYGQQSSPPVVENLIGIVRSAVVPTSSSRAVGQSTVAEMSQAPGAYHPSRQAPIDNTAYNPSIPPAQTHSQMQGHNSYLSMLYSAPLPPTSYTGTNTTQSDAGYFQAPTSQQNQGAAITYPRGGPVGPNMYGQSGQYSHS